MCKKSAALDHQSRRVLIWHEKELLNSGFFLLPSSDRVFVIILKHTFGKKHSPVE